MGVDVPIVMGQKAGSEVRASGQAVSFEGLPLVLYFDQLDSTS